MSSCTPWGTQTEPGWPTAYSIISPITSDAYKEFIEYEIAEDAQYITIPFAVTKASSNLALTGVSIENTVDSVVLTGITFTPTHWSTSAVTGLLSASPDSANYVLKTMVFVTGA